MESLEERIQTAWNTVRDSVIQMFSYGLNSDYKSLKTDEEFDLDELKQEVELLVNHDPSQLLCRLKFMVQDYVNSVNKNLSKYYLCDETTLPSLVSYEPELLAPLIGTRLYKPFLLMREIISAFAPYHYTVNNMSEMFQPLDAAFTNLDLSWMLLNHHMFDQFVYEELKRHLVIPDNFFLSLVKEYTENPNKECTFDKALDSIDSVFHAFSEFDTWMTKARETFRKAGVRIKAYAESGFNNEFLFHAHRKQSSEDRKFLLSQRRYVRWLSNKKTDQCSASEAAVSEESIQNGWESDPVSIDEEDDADFLSRVTVLLERGELDATRPCVGERVAEEFRDCALLVCDRCSENHCGCDFHRMWHLITCGIILEDQDERDVHLGATVVGDDADITEAFDYNISMVLSGGARELNNLYGMWDTRGEDAEYDSEENEAEIRDTIDHIVSTTPSSSELLKSAPPSVQEAQKALDVRREQRFTDQFAQLNKEVDQTFSRYDDMPKEEMIRIFKQKHASMKTRAVDETKGVSKMEKMQQLFQRFHETSEEKVSGEKQESSSKTTVSDVTMLENGDEKLEQLQQELKRLGDQAANGLSSMKPHLGEATVESKANGGVDVETMQSIPTSSRDGEGDRDAPDLKTQQQSCGDKATRETDDAEVETIYAQMSKTMFRHLDDIVSEVLLDPRHVGQSWRWGECRDSTCAKNPRMCLMCAVERSLQNGTAPKLQFGSQMQVTIVLLAQLKFAKIEPWFVMFYNNFPTLFERQPSIEDLTDYWHFWSVFGKDQKKAIQLLTHPTHVLKEISIEPRQCIAFVHRGIDNYNELYMGDGNTQSPLKDVWPRTVEEKVDEDVVFVEKQRAYEATAEIVAQEKPSIGETPTLEDFPNDGCKELNMELRRHLVTITQSEQFSDISPCQKNYRLSFCCLRHRTEDLRAKTPHHNIMSVIRTHPTSSTTAIPEGRYPYLSPFEQINLKSNNELILPQEKFKKFYRTDEYNLGVIRMSTQALVGGHFKSAKNFYLSADAKLRKTLHERILKEASAAASHFGKFVVKEEGTETSSNNFEYKVSEVAAKIKKITDAKDWSKIEIGASDREFLSSLESFDLTVLTSLPRGGVTFYFFKHLFPLVHAARMRLFCVDNVSFSPLDPSKPSVSNLVDRLVSHSRLQALWMAVVFSSTLTLKTDVNFDSLQHCTSYMAEILVLTDINTDHGYDPVSHFGNMCIIFRNLMKCMLVYKDTLGEYRMKSEDKIWEYDIDEAGLGIEDNEPDHRNPHYLSQWQKRQLKDVRISLLEICEINPVLLNTMKKQKAFIRNRHHLHEAVVLQNLLAQTCQLQAAINGEDNRHDERAKRLKRTLLNKQEKSLLTLATQPDWNQEPPASSTGYQEKDIDSLIEFIEAGEENTAQKDAKKAAKKKKLQAWKNSMEQERKKQQAEQRAAVEALQKQFEEEARRRKQEADERRKQQRLKQEERDREQSQTKEKKKKRRKVNKKSDAPIVVEEPVYTKEGLSWQNAEPAYLPPPKEAKEESVAREVPPNGSKCSNVMLQQKAEVVQMEEPCCECESENDTDGDQHDETSTTCEPGDDESVDLETRSELSSVNEYQQNGPLQRNRFDCSEQAARKHIAPITCESLESTLISQSNQITSSSNNNVPRISEAQYPGNDIRQKDNYGVIGPASSTASALRNSDHVTAAPPPGIHQWPVQAPGASDSQADLPPGFEEILRRKTIQPPISRPSYKRAEAVQGAGNPPTTMSTSTAPLPQVLSMPAPPALCGYPNGLPSIHEACRFVLNLQKTVYLLNHTAPTLDMYVQYVKEHPEILAVISNSYSILQLTTLSAMNPTHLGLDMSLVGSLITIGNLSNPSGMQTLKSLQSLFQGGPGVSQPLMATSFNESNYQQLPEVDSLRQYSNVTPSESFSLHRQSQISPNQNHRHSYVDPGVYSYGNGLENLGVQYPPAGRLSVPPDVTRMQHTDRNGPVDSIYKSDEAFKKHTRDMFKSIWSDDVSEDRKDERTNSNVIGSLFAADSFSTSVGRTTTSRTHTRSSDPTVMNQVSGVVGQGREFITPHPMAPYKNDLPNVTPFTFRQGVHFGKNSADVDRFGY